MTTSSHELPKDPLAIPLIKELSIIINITSGPESAYTALSRRNHPAACRCEPTRWVRGAGMAGFFAVGGVEIFRAVYGTPLRLRPGGFSRIGGECVGGWGCC